ncbi:MAG: ADP-ribosylglycohydrolase family protein [Syntrophomonadaceae bacterium]|nr:ADP-ribosylglycohydrolase family protein [Syntrophomonadaceae bacterium]
MGEGEKNRRDQEFFRGCLLGGAVGDALGYAVEFTSLNAIKTKYGPQGINKLPQPAFISDDTQMTMFTGEGLLRAGNRDRDQSGGSPTDIIHHAYLRWLHTQGDENRYYADRFGKQTDDGWLIKLKALHHRRAPGNTCLSALHASEMGTMEKPLNKSKGCGGVMRVAPVGLIAQEPFRLGCEAAAITHGHPTGYLPAGVLAALISELIAGKELRKSIQSALQQLQTYKRYQETLQCVQLALDLLKRNPSDHEQNVRQIGEGWVAEEALAVAIYCALATGDDFQKGLCLAVNHDGDSDSTGAITGNILGAYLGVSAIPADWAAQVELSQEITELADDLLAGYQGGDEWRGKYPGW